MPFIERVIPVLTVKNLKKSRDFYKSILRFKIEWGGDEEDTICSVARDGQSIMLSENQNGKEKGCIWIGLEDDSLFKVCKDKGVKVVLEPRSMPWAYEMKIEGVKTWIYVSCGEPVSLVLGPAGIPA